MGRIPSTSGGVSHREKQGHFTVVLLLCQLSEARTSLKVKDWVLNVFVVLKHEKRLQNSFREWECEH